MLTSSSIFVLGAALLLNYACFAAANAAPSARTPVAECHKSTSVIYAYRFKPRQDLFEELDRLVKLNDIQAGYVVSCVGSLTQASIRFANQSFATQLRGPFEITSLVGTLSSVGGHHIHITVADKQGVSIGGHLNQTGNLIYTTAEVIVGSASELRFAREYMPSPDSGYEELVVQCAD